MRVLLSPAPLSVDAALTEVAHSGAGAIVIMLGTVRDHTLKPDADGVQGPVAVTQLDYSAYDEMAARVLGDVVDGVCAEWPGVRCAVHHRTGTLALGDVAVVVAASAAHRHDAFRACEALIDRLKKDAPIWKREHGADGVVWVGLGP
jgi:molybdopterin synthase catalytic subunit